MAASLTAERAKEMAIKARVTRAANVATRRASTVRREYADSDFWEDLARERKLRLPPWGASCTVSKMRTWLHKAGWSQSRCEEWLGCKLATFPELNPDWALRAFAGIILEVQKEDAINNTTEQREKK